MAIPSLVSFSDHVKMHFSLLMLEIIMLSVRKYNLLYDNTIYCTLCVSYAAIFTILVVSIYTLDCLHVRVHFNIKTQFYLYYCYRSVLFNILDNVFSAIS